MNKTLVDFKALLESHSSAVFLVNELPELSIFLYQLPDARERNLCLAVIDPKTSDILSISYIAPGWNHRKRFLMSKFPNIDAFAHRLREQSGIWTMFTGPLQVSKTLNDRVGLNVDEEYDIITLDGIYDEVVRDFKTFEYIDELDQDEAFE